MPESRPFPQARQDLGIRTRTNTHEKMRSRMQGSAGVGGCTRNLHSPEKTRESPHAFLLKTPTSFTGTSLAHSSLSHPLR
jgi:hypothetical protein